MQRTSTALAVLLSLGLALRAGATDVSYWTHATADDHAGAKLENLAITNYGDVQLTRPMSVLASGVAGVSVVYAVAQAPDGTLYAGTGPEGVLLRIREGGQVDRLVIPDAMNLFALAFDAQGRLLVGTGGASGRVLRVSIEGDQVRQEAVFSAEGVQYVWRIARHADGSLYVATGPTAALYEINPAGQSRQVFTAAGEKNLLSLLVADGDDLFVGTDPNGLVWRVNRRSGEAEALFDAAEPEITALARSGQTLYIVGASRGEAAEGEAPRAGRPVVLGPASPIAGQAVELPQRPDLPPPEPDRIPLGQQQDPPQAQEEQENPERPPGAEEAPPEEAMPGEMDDGPEGFGPPVAGLMGEGSAVYRLDLAAGRPGIAAGVVGVLRDEAMLLDFAEQNGRLLLAAGGSEAEPAKLYQLDPATNELVRLAEPDASQITTLVPLADGRLVLGLANAGGVVAMGARYATEGVLTSAPLDAGAGSTFGTIQLTGRLPDGSELLLSTRSGNTADPESDPGGWGEWSQPQPARQFMPAGVGAGRFFQYRLIFKSSGVATASLERVRIAYQLPNVAPQVTSLQVNVESGERTIAELVEAALEAGASPGALRGIEWEAEDANGDPLTYDLYLRKGQRGAFELIAEGLTTPGYAWDTKTSGDGVYEVRVVASDARGNAPGAGLTASRVSEPVTVDLTPPSIGDLRVEREADVTRVTLRVADAGGVVARLEYLLEGDPAERGNWIRAFPEDTMADSPQERFALELRGPRPASGSVRLRAVDDSGNLAYQSVPLP